jgi:hypothetical protein
LAVTRLGIGSGAVKHPQNRLRCPVKRISSFWLGARLWRELNDCFRHTGYAITHRTAPYVAGNTWKVEHFLSFEAIGGLWITHWLPLAQVNSIPQLPFRP